MKKTNRAIIIVSVLLGIPFGLLFYSGKSSETASGTNANFVFTNSNSQSNRPSLKIQSDFAGNLNDLAKISHKEGISSSFTPLASAPTGSGTLINLIFRQMKGRTHGLIFVRNTPISVDPPGTIYEFSSTNTPNNRDMYMELVEDSGRIYIATTGNVIVAENKGKYVTLLFKNVGFQNERSQHHLDQFKLNGTLVYSEKDIQTNQNGVFASDSISMYPSIRLMKIPTAPLFSKILKQ